MADIELTWEQKQRNTEAWQGFLLPMGFDGFFTLTFKERSRSSINAINRTVSLLKDFYKPLGKRPVAFIVAEEHAAGGWHTHGLLRTGALSDEMASEINTGLWREGRRRFGMNRFSVIKNPDAATRYVSKYLTKQVADHRFLGKV